MTTASSTLGAGTFVINALFGLLTFVAAAFGAHAQERVVFVGKTLAISRWCGGHAIILGGRHGPIWFDVFDKKRIDLRVTKSDVWLLACSPDGRWVLVREGRIGGAEAEEGSDDPGCNPDDKVTFPRVLLWDTKTRTSYAIGTGFFDFAWSADGKTLLYRPLPYCGLEAHPRTRLRWPAWIPEFRPISLRALLAQTFAGVSGWVDDGRIGAVGWINSDKFVAQLPEREGDALTDLTAHGAIVMVELADGRSRRATQLHPIVPPEYRHGHAFRTTRLFDIPQLSEKASDDIVRAAGCYMMGEGMGCDTDFYLENIRVNLARYCANLTEKNPELCARAGINEPWGRLRRGGTVLLMKDMPGTALMFLFRVEHDQGGYLK